MRGIAARYYFLIRSVLKDKPELKNCLKRCKHCQILFFTHPRNANRNDLGCPFGCRDALRKKRSAERSTQYYQSKEGRDKKGELNKRRRKQTDAVSGLPYDLECAGKNETSRETMIHIQIVIRLIDGHLIDIYGIHDFIIRLRQRSIDFYKNLNYSCKKPP